MLAVRQLTRPGLQPFDLDLADGTCVALRGPSGAGKTILLRAIADIDPSDGQVSLDGTDRWAMPAPEWRRKVGYLAAEPGWWAETPAEHFTDPDAAHDLLDKLGLDVQLLERPVARLSTGERQRLALARMLVLAPRVLLLDEPTSGLDPDATARVEALLRRELGRGTALLLVTHTREQGARMAEQHYTVNEGQVREAAP